MSTTPRNIGTTSNHSGRCLGRRAAGTYGRAKKSKVGNVANRAVRRVVREMLKNEQT